MVDDDFLILLVQHNMKQFVDQSTRRSTSNTHENILDFVIMPETSTLITAVSVVISHYLFNHYLSHYLSICDLKLALE